MQVELSSVLLQEALRIGRWSFCMFVFVFMAYILINSSSGKCRQRDQARICISDHFCAQQFHHHGGSGGTSSQCLAAKRLGGSCMVRALCERALARFVSTCEATPLPLSVWLARGQCNIWLPGSMYW